MFDIGIRSIAARMRRFAGDARGAVAVIGALSLTTLVGMGAFAVEISRGYAADTANQRIADMAALAGALAYNVNSNTSQMTATAKAVVAAQGLPSSAATVALVTDAASAKQLVQVSVTTPVPLALGRVFTSALSYDVTAVGSATTTTTTTTSPPCIVALNNNNSTGITLDGGVSISAAGCAVNTNGRVTVPYGTSITAKQVNAGGTVVNPGNGITTAPTAGNIVANKANAASDWMKEDSGLKAALCQVNKLAGSSDSDYADGNTACISQQALPVTLANTSTEDWTTGYVPLNAGTPHQYQTSAYSCQYNIPMGTWTIRKLTIGGGCTMTFASGSTLKFESIDLNGTLTIGDGNVTVVNTLTQNSDLTMGNGNHSFGAIAISGGRTLTIGTGNFNLGKAISIGGGTKIYINIGAGNSVAIGNDGSGTAINLGNGSLLCFTVVNGSGCVAPTAAGGNFSVNGQVVTGGGSTLVFPKAATHIINGSLSSAGSMTFGAGLYVLNGSFTNGTGGQMSGQDVTFAMSGIYSLGGGTSLDLAAPGALSSYGLPGILFATKSSAGASMYAGANGRYAGLIYAPKSDVSMQGGSSISGYGSSCMMMIVKTLSLTQGGAMSTGACSSLSSGSANTANVALFK